MLNGNWLTKTIDYLFKVTKVQIFQYQQLYNMYD
jgi:hypothetical protein